MRELSVFKTSLPPTLIFHTVDLFYKGHLLSEKGGLYRGVHLVSKVVMQTDSTREVALHATIVYRKPFQKFSYQT